MKFNPNDFWEKYNLIGSTKSYISGNEKKNICRYCGKNENETTFLQDTHLLPELLGANSILTFDECDKCNKLFGDYESHLSTFLRPHATLLGIKGKKKIPMFQSRSIDRDENTRTILKYVGNNKIQLYIQDIEDYKLDKENKTFEILFRKPPYIPIKVYKALLKIALSLLPIQYDKYNQGSFKWLQGKIETIPFISTAFFIMLKTVKFNKASADLYRATILSTNEVEYPEYTLVLNFANLTIQIFLPFSYELKRIHDSRKNLDINIHPSFVFDTNNKSEKAQIRYYNLNINESITADHTISFTYSGPIVENS